MKGCSDVDQLSQFPHEVVVVFVRADPNPLRDRHAFVQQRR